MVSVLSSSKQQSTYGQSRLSFASTSASEVNGAARRSTIASGYASAHSNKSNHVSGLGILNSENHGKPLRIERIDPNTKSIKWASSLSDDTDNMKMCNNDFITKNKDDVAKVKEVTKGKKQVMTKNQRRKNNQNNLEDKLLTLKLKDLERQQSTLQATIKRERYKLLDQYMNSKANNMNYTINRTGTEVSNIDLSALKNQKKYKFKSNQTETNYTERYDDDDDDAGGPETERYSKSSRSRASYSSFRTKDLLRWTEFINQPPPTPKPNHFSKIDERFIDQKIKYFPSYLRKTKSSIVTADVDTALSRVKQLSLANRQFCTKHKKHRLAQIKADLYNNSKDMFGTQEEKVDIDQQMADAEAAAAAEIAANAAAKEGELEDHYSFGNLTPTSQQQFNLDSKTPLPEIKPSK